MNAMQAHEEVEYQRLKLILCEVDRKGLNEKWEVRVTKKSDSNSDTEIFLRLKHPINGGIHAFRPNRKGTYYDRWANTRRNYTTSQLIELLNKLAKD